MIDGRTLLEMTSAPTVAGGSRFIKMEQEHEEVKFKQYLKAGPTEYLAEDGEWVIGYREQDIIQFWAHDGGLRTVAATDITIL